MAIFDLETCIKNGVEKALNKPIVNGKSITELAAIGMKAPHWISVKDRLPEYNGQYIVYMPASGAVIAAYYFKNNGGFFIGESIVTDKVSHWIYLPEPPKEG